MKVGTCMGYREKCPEGFLNKKYPLMSMNVCVCVCVCVVGTVLHLYHMEWGHPTACME